MKHEPQSPPSSKGTGTDIGGSSATGSERGPAAMGTGVLPQPKQIRFVNNEGRPPAKRRRVDSACQTCRKRKIRCDGGKPKCSTCEINRHECLGYLPATPQGAGPSQKGPQITQRESGDAITRIKTIKHEEGEQSDAGRIPLSARALNTSQRKSPVDGHIVRRRSSASPHRYENSADRDSKYSDDDLDAIQSAPRHKVPYFRWFGPTAIVRTGYRQMVVAVDQPTNGPNSISSASPHSLAQSDDGFKQPLRRASVTSDSRASTIPELPYYEDKNDAVLHRLIPHLVEVFFKHLGCNFPFLNRNKIIRLVETRKLAPILVNVICALAARFSRHVLLLGNRATRQSPAHYGKAFSMRAKALVTDEFVRPSAEGAQAMLLLAYEAFGAGQDSALWHYEGLAIRMVIDVGLQSRDGIQLQRPSYMDSEDDQAESSHGDTEPSPQNPASLAEREAAVERERYDTIWAIFALDRYISSGLGRPTTMRMDEFDLDLPDIALKTPQGLAAPLPALIHIMQMYGQVSDLLNDIKGAEDVTTHTIKAISDIEGEMLLFYNSLDARLQFSIEHFVEYLEIGEGTNFIMLHLWFHTVVILVNCPAICDDKVVLPSHKLSLATLSAKTIADLADAAQFADRTVIAGNPFTTQPLFIAASAFLYFMSQNKKSVPTSREESPEKKPMRKPPTKPNSSGFPKDEERRKDNEMKAAEKGYQQCFSSLTALEKYWAGTKYIITILKQKAEGVSDPEAFTAEEMESTKVRPSTLSAEKWTRQLPIGVPSPNIQQRSLALSPRISGSMSPPPLDTNNRMAQRRLWAMTGTTNSPNSHVTWLPPQPNEAPSPAPSHSSSTQYYDPIRSSLPETVRGSNATASYSPYAGPGYHAAHHQRMQHTQGLSNHNTYNGETMHDASLLVDLRNSPHPQTRNSNSMGPFEATGPHHVSHSQSGSSPQHFGGYGGAEASYSYVGGGGHYGVQSQSQSWMHAQYGDVVGGFGGGAQQMNYLNTEMDMPTLMQSMDDNGYDLDFLPQEYTARGGGGGGGHGLEGQGQGQGWEGFGMDGDGDRDAGGTGGGGGGGGGGGHGMR